MRLLNLEAKPPVDSFFISFEGLTVLRAYGWARPAEESNLKRLNESQSPYYLLCCLQRWFSLVLDVVDGKDTATFNLNPLRKSLVVLPQDPIFMARTVRYGVEPLERRPKRRFLPSWEGKAPERD